MKKVLFLAAALFTFGLFSNAQAAQELPLVGEYVNDAGYLVIAKAANGQAANYDVGIVDKTGKCNLQIVCGTWKTSETTSAVSKATHPNTIVAVESQKYPNFSLWPEDEKIRLSESALPLDTVDPACKVFKDNPVFTRKN